MNKEFFTRNRKKLVEKMKDNSILVMFAGAAPYKSGDEEYHFSPNRNFFYITGITEPKIILTISKSNGKVSETVFVEREDPIMAKWVGAAMTIDEAREASGVEDVTYLDKFKETFSSAVARLEIKRVYLDFERMEFDLPLTPAQSFAKDVRERYPHLKLKDIYNDIAELRVIKSDEEVKKISKAIDITKDGIYNMIKNIKPGMKENEVEAYFDFEIKRQGASDFAFSTIAAAGKNATVLHYHANNAEIKDGDLMLFDLGAAYEHCNGDISRTFPINGKFTERQKAVYNVVLRTMKEIESAAKPGISLMGLNDVAKKCLADGCRELGLIKEDSELIKYYFHSIGHYLGLDTHDVGDRNKPMEPGMVITNEPGLYIEEEGIGIRIEDDLLITEDGCINLSKHVIKEVDEIEEFMKNR